MLFTFPSRYWFAIGHARVLRLGGWSPQFQTGFHVSRPTRGQSRTLCLRGCHPFLPRFPTCSASFIDCHWPGPRSLAATDGVSVDVLSFGYLDVSVPRVRFLHPILFRCRYLITIPRNLFCPHGQRPADGAAQKGRRALPYEGSPSKDQSLQNRFSRYLRWVSPFGYPWIKAYSQLPTAFRSVSRPSSPVHAKASTNCPYFT